MRNYDDLKILENCPSVCLISHEDPDADALCSMVVFREFLLNYMNVKTVDIFADANKIPEAYEVILDNISINKTPINYHTSIMMDATADDRLGIYSNLFLNCENRIVIDHHRTNKLQGNVNIVEIVSSTCELVYQILSYFKFNISKESKGKLYAGTITDTNRLSVGEITSKTFNMISDFANEIDIFSINEHFFSNTTLKNSQVYAMAINNMKSYEDGMILISHISKEEAQQFDIQIEDYLGIVNKISNIQGCKFALLIYPKGNEYYASLRTSNGYDVSIIAKAFGGGGHKGASGFLSKLELAQIENTVRVEFEKQLLNNDITELKFKF